MLVGLGGCSAQTAAPRTFHVYQRSLDPASVFHENWCTANGQQHGELYADCMLLLGNAMQDNSGQVYFLSQQPSEPQAPVADAPLPPADEPAPVAPPPSTAYPKGGAARLAGLIDQYKSDLFFIAHPTGQVDAIDVTEDRDAEGGPLVIEDVSWHGSFTGKAYETRMTFAASDNGNGNLGEVELTIAEANNPFPAAFTAAEAVKQRALQWASTKIRARSNVVAVIVSIINRYESVQDGVAQALQYLVNNP
jgi:hypothetical protein